SDDYELLLSRLKILPGQSPGQNGSAAGGAALLATLELWSGRQDLNLRPPDPQSGALPGCATPRCQQRRQCIPRRRRGGGPAGTRTRSIAIISRAFSPL